jgi:hypothetical protein
MPHEGLPGLVEVEIIRSIAEGQKRIRTSGLWSAATPGAIAS